MPRLESVWNEAHSWILQVLFLYVAYPLSFLFYSSPNFRPYSKIRAFKTLRLRLWRSHLPSSEGRSRVNISKLYLLLKSNSSPLGTKRGMNFPATSGERKGSLKSLTFGLNPNFLFCSKIRAFKTLRLRLWRSHLPLLREGVPYFHHSLFTTTVYWLLQTVYCKLPTEYCSLTTVPKHPDSPATSSTQSVRNRSCYWLVEWSMNYCRPKPHRLPLHCALRADSA